MKTQIEELQDRISILEEEIIRLKDWAGNVTKFVANQAEINRNVSSIIK